MILAMAVSVRVTANNGQDCAQDKVELIDFICTCDELASRIIGDFEKGKFVVPSVCGLKYRTSNVDFVLSQKLDHVEFTVNSKCFNIVVNPYYVSAI